MTRLSILLAVLLLSAVLLAQDCPQEGAEPIDLSSALLPDTEVGQPQGDFPAINIPDVLSSPEEASQEPVVIEKRENGEKTVNYGPTRIEVDRRGRVRSVGANSSFHTIYRTRTAKVDYRQLWRALHAAGVVSSGYVQGKTDQALQKARSYTDTRIGKIPEGMSVRQYLDYRIGDLPENKPVKTYLDQRISRASQSAKTAKILAVVALAAILIFTLFILGFVFGWWRWLIQWYRERRPTSQSPGP